MPDLERTGEGALRVHLEEYEAEIVRRLGGEMRMLLDADIPPTDEVLRRLFPAAYDDPQDERSYRDLVGDDLQAVKRGALAVVERTVGDDGEAEAVLAEDEIDAWLTFLTDARLAIGTRLGVSEETMAAEPDPDDVDDPDAVAYSILHWLGWLQEQILRYTMEGDR